MCLCILSDCHDKQLLCVYMVLTVCFLSRRRSAFCEVGTEVLYIILVKQRLQVFKAQPWLPAVCHHGGLGLNPGETVWDLWWTKWQWDTIWSEYCGFPLQYNSTKARCSPSTTHYCYRSERREKPKNLQKTIHFVTRGTLDSKIHSSIFMNCWNIVYFVGLVLELSLWICAPKFNFEGKLQVFFISVTDA